MKPVILIVDDEPGVRSSLSGVLRDEGYSVEAVSSGEACHDRVTRSPVDLIVLDVWMPGMDGLATLARMRERHVDAQVVLISGHGNIESAVKAIKLGAFDFVEKPLSLDKTVLVVRNALRQRVLEHENRALREQVDRTRTMVGESHAMRQLREQVPFMLEPLLARTTDERGVQQLDGSLAGKAPVASLGQPHGAHAATSDQREQRVSADLEPGQRRLRPHGDYRAAEKAVTIERIAFLEQRLHFRGVIGPPFTKRCQPRLPLRVVQFQRLVEQRTDRAPAVASQRRGHQRSIWFASPIARCR